MNGLIVIDKPAGITSHDVVSRVRRVFGTRRVGHTGTLDPFATGVLVVMVGTATRFARFIDKDEKEYEAVMRFGTRTETGDRTGRAIGEAREFAISRDDLEAVLPNFRGAIEQVPPMYSAIKIGGKKLYELAREGREVERDARAVKIHQLELVEAPDIIRNDSLVTFRVACSAGTYVRTLAEDIAATAGGGAHLEELRRTRAGAFGIDDAIGLDDLAASDDPAAFLLPPELAVAHLREFIVPEHRLAATRNGLATRTAADDLTDGEEVRMIDAGGTLLAIGKLNSATFEIRPVLVLSGTDRT